MTEERVNRQCQHCGNHTVFEVKGSYLYKEYIATRIDHVTEYSLIDCMTCSRPMLEQVTKFVETKVSHDYDTGSIEDWEEVIEEPETTLLYPTTNMAVIPLSSPDMPKDVADDYREARAIYGNSPRSSAALLRLALQKLCKHLGEPGKSLNDDIGALVAKGLPTDIQQALDIIRVIGNNAVHPGEIDLRDEKESVLALFEIINFIINKMITQPQKIAKIYGDLPKSSLQAIEERPQKNSKRIRQNQ